MTTHELTEILNHYPNVEVKLEIDDGGMVYHVELERVYLEQLNPEDPYVVLSQIGLD